MSSINLVPKSDPEGIIHNLHSLYRKIVSETPVGSSETEDVPGSFLRGCWVDRKPISQGMKGFSLEGNKIIVGELGELEFYFDLSRIRKPTRIGIEQTSVTIYYIGKLKGRKPFKHTPRHDTNINEIRKRDPIMDFLVVNEILARYGAEATWKIRDALEYISENPDLTMEEIEKLGIARLRYIHHHNIDDSSEISLKEYEKRTQSNGEMWELISNFHPSLQGLLRAVSKSKHRRDEAAEYQIPPESNILSSGQFDKRWKKEVRLPEVITPHDTDKGNLSRQSYEAQIFKAMGNDNVRDFFS